MASPVFAFPSDYEDLTITQDKILTLSETLLGTLGLSGLETKQIAKRLQVSPSLINHYYKNAEELIFDTVLFSYYKLVKRIYDSFENQRNAELAARGWINEMLDWEMSLPGIGVILEFPRQVLRTGTKATKNADEMLSKFQKEIGKIGVRNVVFMASAVRAIQKNTEFKILSPAKVASLIATNPKYSMFASVLGFATIGGGLWIAGRRPSDRKNSIWLRLGFDPKRQTQTTIDGFIKLIRE